MTAVVRWDGGLWTKESISREIAAYQNHLAMAKREIAAGNDRMRSFAEGYAGRLDSLLLLESQFDSLAEKGGAS